MKRIMCYGDSNTWGRIPVPGTSETDIGQRHDENVRWTGKLQDILGDEYRVLEEGLCGRTAAFEDPLSEDRDGLKYIHIAYSTCRPCEFVVVMLGTNDVKDIFNASADEIAFMIKKLMLKLLEVCRSYEDKTRFLLVNPARVREPADKRWLWTFSEVSVDKAVQLKELLKKVAEELDIYYLDADDIVETSVNDGVHLDELNHQMLAEAISKFITTNI